MTKLQQTLGKHPVVPAYENPDKTHCFQAVLKMILKYHWPDKHFSWQELDTITAKIDGLWTWPTAGLLWLYTNGFELRNVEFFDYTAFATKGSRYLIELFGNEVGQAQIDHSDIAQEIIYAKQFVEAKIHERRVPTINDLKQCLDKNYLLICNVNSRALNNDEGYSGHFVLLTSYTSTGFVLHNPGPPLHKDQHVAFSHFERAWKCPNDQAKNYIAIRKKQYSAR